MLKNNQIALRAIEPEDLDTLYRWENDASIWQNTGTQAPYSRFQLKQYIESCTANPYHDGQLRLMIVSLDSAEVVGAIDLYDIDPLHSRAGVGIIVQPTFQQRGIATQALTLLVQYACSHLNLHQLYAHITPQNVASLHLFSAVRFVHTATLKEWHKTGGSYVDIEVFQFIKADLG